MGLTKKEFMSQYINYKYEKKRKERQDEALAFTLESSYKNNKSWRKQKYGYSK